MIGFPSSLATIFMLHRVAAPEPGRLALNENLKIDPQRLEDFIVGARARGYAFVSLDELHQVLCSGRRASRLLLMTLDDGYADNHQLAWPVFQSHRVPFAVYVASSFPERQAILWWYLLEDLVLAHDRIELIDGTYYECHTPQDQLQSFMRLRSRLMMGWEQERDDTMRLIFGADRTTWLQPVEQLALGWQQIREMSADPLVTIGAHGASHLALAALTDAALRDEVMTSRTMIERHIGKPVEHFCYPFGGKAEADEREFALVAGLGFKTGTTTRYGRIFAGHGKRLTALPRQMLDSHFSWSRFEWQPCRSWLRGRWGRLA